MGRPYEWFERELAAARWRELSALVPREQARLRDLEDELGALSVAIECYDRLVARNRTEPV